jgi:Ulp1 family protease
MKENKTKIGIIFNLDKHDQKGSHWVSMFIDLEEKFIFYFDSAGDAIPPEIRILKDRLIRQAKKLTPPLKLLYKHNHNVEHQLENTECGVYSLFFIITMLTGDCKCGDLDKHNNIKDRTNMSFKDKMALFQKGRIPDSYIERYRKIYFNGA